MVFFSMVDKVSAFGRFGLSFSLTFFRREGDNEGVLAWIPNY